MALQSLKGLMAIPTPLHFASSAPAYVGLQINGSSEKVAFVFQVPKTGTLDKFEFRLGTVTQAPASGLKASFQNVDATTGDPDGTADQYRVVNSGLSSNAWITPGLITSDGTDGGTKRSVTRGEWLACVIEFQSFGTGDDLQIVTIDVQTAIGNLAITLGYADHAAPSSYSKQLDMPVMALKYNDSTYEYIAPHIIPASNLNNITTFNTGSTPDERGLYFKFPFPVKVCGAWVRVDLDGDADIVLYDSDGSTALATTSLDKDIRIGTAGGNYHVLFSSDIQLSKDTYYRLVVKPTSATNVSVYDFDVFDAAYMDGVDGGSSWYHTQRTDAGSWTQTTTKRPWMGLLVRACDDAVSAGGGTVIAPRRMRTYPVRDRHLSRVFVPGPAGAPAGTVVIPVRGPARPLPIQTLRRLVQTIHTTSTVPVPQPIPGPSRPRAYYLSSRRPVNRIVHTTSVVNTAIPFPMPSRNRTCYVPVPRLTTRIVPTTSVVVATVPLLAPRPRAYYVSSRLPIHRVVSTTNVVVDMVPLPFPLRSRLQTIFVPRFRRSPEAILAPVIQQQNVLVASVRKVR